MAERKTMRKDNKILIVVSFFLMGFGAMFSYKSNMLKEILPDESSLRMIGTIIVPIGLILLLAAIGRERARRD